MRDSIAQHDITASRYTMNSNQGKLLFEAIEIRSN